LISYFFNEQNISTVRKKTLSKNSFPTVNISTFQQNFKIKKKKKKTYNISIEKLPFSHSIDRMIIFKTNLKICIFLSKTFPSYSFIYIVFSIKSCNVNLIIALFPGIVDNIISHMLISLLRSHMAAKFLKKMKRKKNSKCNKRWTKIKMNLHSWKSNNSSFCLLLPTYCPHQFIHYIHLDN